MLQIETILKNIDNSGIIKAKIIHIYKSGNKKNKGTINDVVLIASQKNNPRKNIKKKIHFGVIAQIKKKKKRLNGHYVNFNKSCILSLFDKKTFKATRIKEPIDAHLRYSIFTNILLVTKKLI